MARKLDELDREKILIEELKMVQDVIKRMASNSFMLKGWTVAIISALLLLRLPKTLHLNVVIPLIPLLTFWWLDAYYLRQERLFRKLHDWIAQNRMNSDERLFDFSTTQFSRDVSCQFKVMFSETIWPFYAIMAALLLIAHCFAIC